MKKAIISMMLVICIVLSMGATALAADTATKAYPDVRVNGNLVTFTDVMPYIDSNNRTMMPVRFVTESMGATVSWNDKTNTAAIEKNGVKVEITIGNTALKVTKSGATTTVSMDTAAVIKNDRTYVPIRFVAEALGAYVGYSSLCNTVQIYSDVLTKAQIEKLRSYDLVSYWNITSPPAAYATFIGTDGFSNSQEYLFRLVNKSTHTVYGKYSTAAYCMADGWLGFHKFAVVETRTLLKSYYNYSYYNVGANVLVDMAGVYQDYSQVGIYESTRGVVQITVNSNSDLNWIKSTFNITDPKAGHTYNVYVDVKFKTSNTNIVYMDKLTILGSEKA